MHKGGGGRGAKMFFCARHVSLVPCAVGSTLLACIICCTAHAKGAVDVASVNQGDANQAHDAVLAVHAIVHGQCNAGSSC